MLALLVVLAACSTGSCAGRYNGSRHAFYRSMRGGGGGGGGRRVFGGAAVGLEAWGAVCALLDRYWGTRCSGAVLAPRWALTAAHCVSPRIAYVRYNARRPSARDGDVAPVHYLYRHPQYKVVQEDEGRGMDVTTLHHDVGLVRTRADMLLAAPPPLHSVHGMQLYDPRELADQEVDVLGFGRTEGGTQGEVLFAARLVLTACDRSEWMHCVCGAGARAGARAGAGVCAGDSGGPVLYRGAQVAVTSMGPLECEEGGGGGGGAATSVFTALRRYVPLVNATMSEADVALQMSRLSPAAAPYPTRAPAPLLLLGCLCPLAGRV